MWTCLKCGEGIEEAFEACWSCGADRAGRPDPAFRAPLGEDSRPVPPPKPPEPPPDLDRELARRFRCPKCQAEGGRTRRIATRGAGLSRVLDLRLLAVSCSRCGFVEMYDLEVLEKGS